MERFRPVGDCKRQRPVRQPLTVIRSRIKQADSAAQPVRSQREQQRFGSGLAENDQWVSRVKTLPFKAAASWLTSRASSLQLRRCQMPNCL